MLGLEKKDVLLVIVNFNQIHEFPKFLAEVLKYWSKDQMVVVDDGSTDGSAGVPGNWDIKTIFHLKNRGVGAAIRTAIEEARATNFRAVLIMSSNGKMRPLEIDRLINPILEGTADYVTGSRFIRGGSSPGLTKFRRLTIPLFSVLASLALLRRFTDITCGFRCYKINFLAEGPSNISQDWLDRYEMEYYIHYWACEQKLRIQEVPVTIQYDHLGKNRLSKIRPLVDWWSMIMPLFYLRLGLRK
jgi:dolichol-phosphate mannosyltransferase